MEWYEDYSINVEAIDSQHKELFEIVTRLQKALTTGTVNTEIANTIKFLVQYTQQHFKDEEQLMAEIEFSELANHKKLHGKLIDDIKTILLNLKKGKAIHPYELVDFLTDWLLSHIRHEDKKIGRAMAAYTKEHQEWDGTLT